MNNPLTIIEQKNFTLAKLELWEIPATTTEQDWQEWHTDLLKMKQVSKLLLPKSEAFGRATFGDDTWAETEALFQLEFGLPLPEPKSPKHEGDAEFDFMAKNINRWVSACVKQYGDIETWDIARLTYALEVLEPIGEQVARIRSLIGGGGHGNPTN
jgi:hypothetical protein